MGRRLRFVCQLQSSGDVRASRITFQAGCEEIDLGLYLIEEGESRDAETWE
jgi:hypothetical protein